VVKKYSLLVRLISQTKKNSLSLRQRIIIGLERQKGFIVGEAVKVVWVEKRRLKKGNLKKSSLKV